MPRHLTPDGIWLAWSWEPGVVVSIALAGALYAVGLQRLWQTSNFGGGIRRWEALSFALGWLILALALVSPLHTLGGVLFSAHMTQHELLISLGAPLLILGRPLIAFLFEPPAEDEKAWRKVMGEGTAELLAAAREALAESPDPLDDA